MAVDFTPALQKRICKGIAKGAPANAVLEKLGIPPGAFYAELRGGKKGRNPEFWQQVRDALKAGKELVMRELREEFSDSNARSRARERREDGWMLSEKAYKLGEFKD